MTPVRIHEHPDGSVSITEPAPSSRRVETVTRAATYDAPPAETIQILNQEQIAAWVQALLTQAAREAMAADARLGEIPPRAAVLLDPWLPADPEVERGERQAGAVKRARVELLFDVPEPEDAWLERVFAKAVAPRLVDPSSHAARGLPVVKRQMSDGVVRDVVEIPHPLAGLPTHDVDPATLPPRTAPCTDGCGEEHPVRDQWRLTGTGKGRKLQVDAAVRNLHAEHRHLHQAEHAELQKPDLDGARLSALRATREALAANLLAPGLAPPAATVANLTRAHLAERRAGRQKG